MQGMKTLEERIKEFHASRQEPTREIKYKLMADNEFTFFRATCHLFYEDLANHPALKQGPNVWVCGDLHLENFGSYRAFNGLVYFDINDFDETLPAPFEWDIKRLAASIVVAGRYKEFSEKENKKAAFEAGMSYTKKMREISLMRQLEVWYNRIDEQAVINLFMNDKELVKRIKTISEKAKQRTHEFVFPKISAFENNKMRILDNPAHISSIEYRKKN